MENDDVAWTFAGSYVPRGDFHFYEWFGDGNESAVPGARWNLAIGSKRVYNLIMDRGGGGGGVRRWGRSNEFFLSAGPWMRVTFMRNNARWQGTGGHCHACLTDVDGPRCSSIIPCVLSNRTIGSGLENPRRKKRAVIRRSNFPEPFFFGGASISYRGDNSKLHVRSSYRVERKVCPWLIKDEFHTFNLMEDVKNVFHSWNFKVESFLHCILPITKAKLFKGIIGRNLVVLKDFEKHFGQKSFLIV